jgi:hypothetical protein
MKDRDNELLLIEHEKTFGAVASNAAAENPFGIARIRDSELVINFSCHTTGLGFGIRGKENVIDTGG